jgi:hypothetical protein
MNNLLTNTRLLYRLEWLAISIALIWIMIVEVDWSQSLNIGLVIFFLIMPDLAMLAFPATRSGASWPYALYNALHNFILWLAVASIFYLLNLDAVATILAWAIHIAIDRAVGYALRDASGAISSPATVEGTS